jgi:DNA replication and repair protein RecF
MSIRQLRVSEFRNIRQAELELRRINLLCGPNGSGKTSVLEAVYLLGSGRSFRSARLDPVIRHEARRCTVFATVLGDADEPVPVAMGVTRDRDGTFSGRVQGQSIRSSAELAVRLPLQLINSSAFDLHRGRAEGPATVSRLGCVPRGTTVPPCLAGCAPLSAAAERIAAP